MGPLFARLTFYPGSVFCILLRVSSDYAQRITSLVTEVICPLIGRAQSELTLSKRQKTDPGHWACASVQSITLGKEAICIVSLFCVGFASAFLLHPGLSYSFQERLLCLWWGTPYCSSNNDFTYRNIETWMYMVKPWPGANYITQRLCPLAIVNDNPWKVSCRLSYAIGLDTGLLPLLYQVLFKKTDDDFFVIFFNDTITTLQENWNPDSSFSLKNAFQTCAAKCQPFVLLQHNQIKLYTYKECSLPERWTQLHLLCRLGCCGGMYY